MYFTICIIFFTFFRKMNLNKHITADCSLFINVIIIPEASSQTKVKSISYQKINA
jgi:hypothetical protein